MTDDTNLLGRRIGHYRLLRRLGEGGMGVVYLAEREDEFRQRVALKLVRCAPDSAGIRRFHMERQMLAALSHPNIVTLIDGGAATDGAPYLVMEYVEGTPIDSWANQRRLSVSERLRAFLQVCAAVQYAHQNLVVHCDLKPGNILVTEDGTPKLLDFGVAKLVAPAGTTQLTQTGNRPFTPNYASPEQLRGEPLTTATDVYALGIILYELLTGRSPYRLQTHSAAELVAAVCVQAPERPSTAVSRRQSPEAGHGSQTREGSPERLRRRLSGDLDAVLLKALRKEPGQRYASVEHLAEDIRRHLEGRPVLARRGTLRYRASKFIARHRLGAAAAAVAVLATVFGVTGMVWQAREAMVARARAERRFNDVRKLAHFLLFDFHDAVQKLPGSTPVQEMLVKRSLEYLDGLAAEAGGDPGLQRELVEAYTRFGDVQGNPYGPNLGDTAGALASYRKALGIAESLDRLNPRDRGAALAKARVHAHTGDVLFLLRRMDEAVAQTRQSLAMLEPLVASAPRDFEARVDLASGYEGLGDQLNRGVGDRAGAMEGFRKSLANWQEAARIDPANIRARRAVATLNMKIAEMEAAADPRGALDKLRAGLTALESLPAAERATVPSRRLAANLHRRIGDCLWELKDLKASLEAYGKARETAATLLSLDPTNSRAQYDLVVVLNNMGGILEAAGDVAGALRDYSQAADGLDALIKSDPGNTSWRADLAEILVRIGVLLHKTGMRADASRQTARGLAAAREIAEKPGTAATELTRAARMMATCEPAELRQPEAAVRYALRAVELTKGADAYALDTLAEAYLAGGNKEAAADAIQKGLNAGPSQWVRRMLEAKLKRVGKSP